MDCKRSDFQQIVNTIEKDRDNQIKDRYRQKGNMLQERKKKIEMITQRIDIWIGKYRD